MVRRARKTKRRQVAKAAMLAIRYAARPIRQRTRTRGGEKQTRKITRDPAATRRWEEWKRRPPRNDGTLRAPGHAEALKATRKEIGSRTLECPRCGLLVDWRAAKSAATKARRELRAGDGCRGRRCGKRRRARSPERARAQIKMARALLNGTRTLAAWPAHALDWQVWTRPKTVCVRIARRTLRKFE